MAVGGGKFAKRNSNMMSCMTNFRTPGLLKKFGKPHKMPYLCSPLWNEGLAQLV